MIFPRIPILRKTESPAQKAGFFCARMKHRTLPPWPPREAFFIPARRLMKDLTSDTFGQAAISVSGKVTAGGSITAVGSGVAGKTAQMVSENPETAQAAITLADAGVLFGMVVGGVGLVVNVYFKWQRHRMDKVLFDEQLKKVGGER